MASPPFTGFPFSNPPPSPPPPPPPPFFPPPTLQASPNSDHHTTTFIFIAFVSFGSLLLLGTLCFACWCLIRKNKRVRETKDVVDVDEHFRVEELVVPGRHGPRIEMMSVEEEMNVHERMRKNETDEVEKGLRGVGGTTAKEASGSNTVMDVGRGGARSSP